MGNKCCSNDPLEEDNNVNICNPHILALYFSSVDTLELKNSQ